MGSANRRIDAHGRFNSRHTFTSTHAVETFHKPKLELLSKQLLYFVDADKRADIYINCMNPYHASIEKYNIDVQ